MKIRTLLGLGAALCAAVPLTLALTGVRADDAARVKLVGDPQVDTGLLKKDIDELNVALSKAKPEKKDVKRARVLALVVALKAQAMGDKGEAAAVYEQAGKVILALAKEDGLAEAKEAAKGLVTAKTASGARPAGDLVKAALFDPDPTVNDWDRDLAMQLFKTARAGGLGIESKIKDWAGKPPVGKDVDLALPYAQKSAVMGAVLEQVAAPKDKPADDWKKYARQMREASEEAMKLAAAPQKNGQALMAAFNKLDTACTNCHDKYK